MMLLRVLRNVLDEPENAKYRALRLTNPKLKAAVLDVPAALAALELAGFVVVRDADGETHATLLQEDGAPELAAVRDVVDALEPLVAPPPPADVPPPGGRDERVFKPAEVSLARLMELPDEYFKRSPEELKAEMQQRKAKREAEAVLTTKAHKERLAAASAAKAAVHYSTTVRVRLPDGLLLQGCFGAKEKVETMYEWVASSLREPDEFMLKFGNGRDQVAHATEAGAPVTLSAAGLVPSALVAFQWRAEGRRGQPALLREDLYRRLESLEG